MNHVNPHWNSCHVGRKRLCSFQCGWRKMRETQPMSVGISCKWKIRALDAIRKKPRSKSWKQQVWIVGRAVGTAAPLISSGTCCCGPRFRGVHLGVLKHRRKSKEVPAGTTNKSLQNYGSTAFVCQTLLIIRKSRRRLSLHSACKV